MLDATQIFDSVAGVALTATRASTNVLDFLVKRDVGVGDELEIHAFVQTTLASSGGTATLTVALQASSDNSNFYTVLQTGAIPEARLTAGRRFMSFKVPILNQELYLGNGAVPGPQYLQLYYTVGTENFTSGKIGAYLTGAFDRDQFVAYPTNYATV